MANEYLKRTPTSTGNRRVFTWSGWVKRNNFNSSITTIFSAATSGNDQGRIAFTASAGGAGYFIEDYTSGATQLAIDTSAGVKSRDFSSWMNLVVVVDTTKTTEDNRAKIYINGALYAGPFSSEIYTGGINYNTRFNQTIEHTIGWLTAGGSGYNYLGQFTDIFFIDGQALTPDVFGFYKVGKGYISVGSTQATDFRPGQWVPKTPRVIKTAINNNGGFGVNGFYLPMNDSKNFGADFHCDPNSIITLNEKLPQPRVGVATTASVGIGYTDALRADPYAANLVLALPFVSGGLQSGFGDYSAAIKGSGTQKSFTTNGNVAIANTAGYYGSSSYFDGNGDYLRTSTNISDFQFGTGDFTIETWLWKSANGVNNYDAVATLGTSGNATDGWFLEVSATRGYFWYVAGSGTYTIHYNVSPNTSQWNHLAVCRKANTTTMYLNGVAVGINTNAYTVPATATTLDVGGYAVGSGNYWFNGYLQDLRIYKGVAKYTGGFDVPRPYTPVGIATWRAVPDTTANNFATWNPAYPVITGSNAVYTNGNLTIAEPTGNTSQGTATIGVSTGKWYYEAFPSNVTTDTHLIGIRPAEWFTDNAQNRTAYRSSGNVYNDAGTVVQSGTTYTSSDIIGVAFDMNTKQLWFSKNGSWVYSGNPSGGSNQAVSFASTYTHYTPVFCFDNVAGTQTWDTNFGQNPTFSGNTTAGTYADTNGKGLFKYQPPSGFLALCEDNLPTPAIANPGRHFKTVLFRADGNPRSIVGVGFTPDLVWFKYRNAADNHVLVDSVRGVGKRIFSDLTNAELDTPTSLMSFDYDGFSIGTHGSINTADRDLVVWCWKAGAGTTSTNTNGSITSVVSANQDAGFSIVSYTGTGASGATVGHGLGKVPKFIITKSRTTADDWFIYHSSVGNGSYVLLNSTAASTVSSTIWNNTSPTSTTFSLGTSGGANRLNDRLIAYCWAEIEGYSKFGSYTGNGSTDGPFVYCGFKPAWVMIKNISGSHNWEIYDSSMNPINPVGLTLLPNTSDIQTDTTPRLDFLSNGFKLRNIGGSVNGSGNTIIFAAYAESPFTTANAK